MKISTLAESSIYCLFNLWKPSTSMKSTGKRTPKIVLFGYRNLSMRLSPRPSNSLSPNRFRPLCFFNAKDESGGDFQQKGNGGVWPILRRWDVPWGWQTVSLTSLACGLSFVVKGLVESAAIPYLGIRIEELSLDEKAELLLLDQGDPMNLQKGWLLWAGVGLVDALASIAVTGAVLSSFNGGSTQRETDALVRLLPLIGSSSIRLLAEALLVWWASLGSLLQFLKRLCSVDFLWSLTKWIPTPVSVLISAAVFALAHLTPGEFSQLFVLGTFLGFSYAQTHNLLTPITMHALWNSGVILLLTFLTLQGYDIKELLQTT